MLSAAFAVFLVTSLSVWGKPPEVKYFFPAGAQIGSEVTLTVTGDFSDWPVEGVSEPAGLEFTAAEEKGKLQVTSPRGCRAGNVPRAADFPPGRFQLETAGDWPPPGNQ
jgi:hypothetical protein